jgi:hypothetical protein
MRLVYFRMKRQGRHAFGSDFHSVDAHRRRLGNSTRRRKRAVLLAQTSRWPSPLPDDAPKPPRADVVLVAD